MSARVGAGSVGRRNRAAGFTLIEIMIALSVFAVGALALAAIIPLGFKRNDKSSQQSRASEIVATCGERLLHTPYSEDDLASGVHDDPDNPHPGQLFLRWTVEDNQPINFCKRVTIQVHRSSLTAPVVAKSVIVTSEAGS